MIDRRYLLRVRPPRIRKNLDRRSSDLRLRSCSLAHIWIFHDADDTYIPILRKPQLPHTHATFYHDVAHAKNYFKFTFIRSPRASATSTDFATLLEENSMFLSYI